MREEMEVDWSGKKVDVERSDKGQTIDNEREREEQKEEVVDGKEGEEIEGKGRGEERRGEERGEERRGESLECWRSECGTYRQILTNRHEGGQLLGQSSQDQKHKVVFRADLPLFKLQPSSISSTQTPDPD
ncbi:Pecanex-like protein 2 [Dissostichus eleginoides]|uniref:Pecanex-like protein 2 n=1 Tax=Dissostichus eleginoides TaxID=100907 RepID=A0AAD9C0K7_DISEL|nr:Pecanex-like protein 2 [Dissostichus eleginoides]